MSQITDITDELNGVKATLQEIGADVDTLQATIVALQAQIANMPAGPELDALKVVADDVAAQASGIAAKVPPATT